MSSRQTNIVFSTPVITAFNRVGRPRLRRAAAGVPHAAAENYVRLSAAGTAVTTTLSR